MRARVFARLVVCAVTTARKDVMIVTTIGAMMVPMFVVMTLATMTTAVKHILMLAVRFVMCMMERSTELCIAPSEVNGLLLFLAFVRRARNAKNGGP